MKILGVNGKTFSTDRFARALQQTPETGQVELLIVDGDAYRTVVVDYDGGPRFPKLKRRPEGDEWLKKICAPSDMRDRGSSGDKDGDN